MKNPGVFFQTVFSGSAALVLALAFPGITGAQVPPGSVCTPPPSGMVSWWDGDAVTGTTAEDIKDGNNGALVRGVGIVPAVVGEGFSFDGVDDEIRVPDNSNLRPSQEITIDLWIKPDSVSSMHRIYSHDNVLLGFQTGGFCGDGIDGDSTSPCLAFGLRTGGIWKEFEVAGPVVNGLTDGNFHHIAATYDGLERIIYIDGVPAGNASDSGAIGTGGTADLVFGSTGGPLGGINEYFVGVMDEIELFDRALSETEVASIHNAGGEGKCKGCLLPPPDMVSWWDGDAVTGTAVEDIQGNNDGTMLSGVTVAPGKVGNGFSFNGSTGGVEIPSDATLQPSAEITIDAWIQPNIINAEKEIYRHDNGGSSRILLSFQGSYCGDGIGGSLTGPCLSFGLTTGGTYKEFEVAGPLVLGLIDGNFHHVAATYDGVERKIYIDGALAGSAADTGAIGGGGTFPAYIGAGSPSFEVFSGVIDELELFSRALSITEIADIYNAGTKGKCKDLISLVSLDVTPKDAVIIVGETLQFTATGTFSDGSSRVLMGETWDGKTPMATSRFGFGGGVLDDVFYVFGGLGGFPHANIAAVESYDPTTNTWSNLAPMPSGRRNHPVGVVNGKFYSIGGNVGSVIANVDEYNPVTNTWTAKNPLPTKRRSSTVGVVNGKLYAISGIDDPNMVSVVESFDPLTGNWTTGLTPIPTARAEATGVVLNDKIYVIGGGNNSGNTNAVEAYVPATDFWEVLAPIPTLRQGYGAGAINGKIYVIGGSNGVDGIAVVEAYDPATDTWTTGHLPMTTRRAGHTAGVINGKIYLAGGWNSDNQGGLNTLEVFTPAEVIWDSSNPSSGPINQGGLADGQAAGSTTITATSASDASLSGSTSLTVLNPNQPPTALGQNVVTPEDTAVVITLTGSDPDGDSLVFSIGTLPSNGSLSGVSQVSPTSAAVTYTPGGNYNGPDSLTFQVFDGTVISTPAAVSIGVAAVNDPPTANAGPDQMVPATSSSGANVTLDGTGSGDIDDVLLTYSWTDSFGTAAGSSPTVLLSAGVHTVTLTVSDIDGAEGVDTVMITVFNPDGDGDGVWDFDDACPTQDATGFDADGDGCVDTLSGLTNVLATLVLEGVVDQVMESSLTSKIGNAEKSADKDNICAAVSQLEALKNQIEAQRGKKISDEAANLLIGYADNIISGLLAQLPEGASC